MEIDWNDPDFCNRYQRKDGAKIAGKFTLPEPFKSYVIHPHFCKFSNDQVSCYNDYGHWIDGIESHWYNIVPISREPRTIEGWVTPGAFDAAVRGSQSVLTYQPHCPEEWVKVKITEVME